MASGGSMALGHQHGFYLAFCANMGHRHPHCSQPQEDQGHQHGPRQQQRLWIATWPQVAVQAMYIIHGLQWQHSPQISNMALVGSSDHGHLIDIRW